MKQLDKEKGKKDEFLNLYFRILTDYFQLISTIGKIKMNFFYGIGEFFDKFSFISDFLGNFFLFFYPLDCFYNSFINKDIGVFYINLYMLLSLYPMILFINIVYWGLKGLITKKTIQWMVKRFFLAIFMISYLLQQSFIKGYFKYLNCIPIGEKLYLRSYLIEQCWVEAHIFNFSTFILPSLVFWMLVYPCIVLFMLKSRLKKVNSKFSLSIIIENNDQMFSFFTDGLKENFYYWEILLMFRKYIFIILSIFPITNTLILNLWILCIFTLAFLFFQVIKKPYKFEKAIKISILSNIIIYFSVLGLTLLYIENNALNQMIFLSVFVILNTILFWKWGYDIYQLKKQEMVEKFLSLKQSISDILSRIGGYMKSSNMKKPIASKKVCFRKKQSF